MPHHREVPPKIALRRPQLMGKGEGGTPSRIVRGHGVLSSMRLKARQLCVPWVREVERQLFASQNYKCHHASFLKET